ncbi:HAD-IIB family hydrolase [Baaleninema sp.]|uniref:HAD-IIB family hydrolase n=1 Tax=Baaleninema sp. TaxID=3101197 RepID=UPI003CFEAEB7
MAFIVFTDLDGTLLNSEDYRYEAALPVLQELKNRKIPVIPVTSKTRAEVELLRRQIGLNDPFIVENGSGVFVARGDDRFEVSDTDTWEGYHLKRFGLTYSEARQQLAKVATRLGEELRGLGDLSLDEVGEFTGLFGEDAERAKARDFTEPFVTPKDLYPKTLEEAVATVGCRVVVGDRFSHLIGKNAGKGKAVRWLIDRFRHDTEELVTVGLGNSPNDLELLETVDRAIVVPDMLGRPHPQLSDRGWEVAPSHGCQGWANAVTSIFE